MNKALEYLINARKLTPETINTFLLGYCDPTGLVFVGTSNYCTRLTLGPQFKDSTVFPIYDLYNKQVGVSARTFGAGRPKYVNTVYAKTDHLFGLQQTWKYCLQTRKVYIVEGNVDTLMMYQAGIRNVVGMLGSNLSQTQLCLLTRFVDEVVVVPDGDTAGRKFLNKIRTLTPKLNIHLKFVMLPDGLDPDNFLKQWSASELLKLEQSFRPTLQERVYAL